MSVFQGIVIVVILLFYLTLVYTFNRLNICIKILQMYFLIIFTLLFN